MINNPFMPTTRFNSYIARGGGGGGDGGGVPTPAPAPTLTSTYPELEGKTYATEAERTTAETAVNAERAKAAALTQYQADVGTAVSGVDTTGMDEIAKQQAYAAAAQGVEAGEGADVDATANWLKEQQAMYSGAGQAAALESQLKTASGQREMATASVSDPASLTTTADVATIDQNAPGTTVADTVGQLGGAAPTITDPNAFNAAAVDPTKAAGQVATAADAVQTVQGGVSEQAQVTAASTDPAAMAALALQAEQLAQAQVITPAAERTLGSGELISGSAVDMAAVDEALDIQAAQANPSAQATVRGQMAELMQDFEGEAPPAWAAGALRNATAQMAARGLGASSMAGQALIQAAMESALPIAMADSQTFAKFEAQNLSNRQQTAMFAAEQRANFLGMEFTQEFQSRVANAAKVSDIANMNFTAETQIALENARMAQTVDLANLNAKNAKMMSDAAALSQMDMVNLNNRQQAAVMNAQSFLQMDMKNMDLAQQTELFKAQSNIQAIFSDQAADNAAKQFNASSENQTKQFFATMSQQVQQFNAGMEVQRDQFNAQNALIVAQANAQWRQNATTIDTAAQNQANADAAMQTNQMTQTMVDTLWQRERDIMDYAFRQSENESDRALSVFLADKQVELAEWQTSQANKQADKEGKGYLVSRLLFG